MNEKAKLEDNMRTEYKIINPAPSKWLVYYKEEYDNIADKYNMYSPEWFDNENLQNLSHEELDACVLAEFKTRHAAREYVLEQGGMY